MRPYEIVGVTKGDRYEIRRLGKNLITKAPKEQLHMWPTEWSVGCGMDDLLNFLETDEIAK